MSTRGARYAPMSASLKSFAATCDADGLSERTTPTTENRRRWRDRAEYFGNDRALDEGKGQDVRYSDTLNRSASGLAPANAAKHDRAEITCRCAYPAFSHG